MKSVSKILSGNSQPDSDASDDRDTESEQPPAPNSS